jgi:uncharacterized protein YbjT (DUF2867 family)
MKIVLYGATGLVGRGVLLEALDDPTITGILAVGRSPTGESHAKLNELTQPDLFDIAAVQKAMRGHGACIFCVGVSAVGMNEADYTHVTYDLTLAVAKAFLAMNPDSTFAYVTGQGTDSTERGGMMWARVKGRTENALLALPFRAATMFRPGVIQPLRGIRSRTALYRILFVAVRPFASALVRRDAATDTTLMGLAMLEAVEHPPAEPILDNEAINALGRQRLARRA